MTTAFPLAWPPGWPRTVHRARGKFGIGTADGGRRTITLAVAVERLDRELTLLGVRDPVLSSNVERHLDGRIRLDRAPPADPGAAVYFVLADRPTALAADRWDRVADNVAALAKHLEALRGIDRWGVGTAARAFAGYTALAAPEPWWQILGVAATAGVDEINAAYRALAQSAANRGSDAALARLNVARDDGRRAARAALAA